MEQETLYQMHTNIKRTGNLPSDEGFIICDSNFDETCFERDLKITMPVRFFLPF